MAQRLVAILTALCLALVAGPSAGASGSGADLAVTLALVDADEEPQRLRATVTNQGPQASEHAVLELVTAEGQEVVAHDGDPQPGSLADGVACAASDDGFSCQWTALEPGDRVEVTVDLAVHEDGAVTARLSPAGTPDPNPEGNNRASLEVTPATTDLAVTIGVDDGERTAELTVSVTHVAGREDQAALVVTPAPADAPPGCTVEDGDVRCPVPALAAGEHAEVDLLVERPEPGQEPLLVSAAVVPVTFEDPAPGNNTATVEIAPRDTVAGAVVRLAGAERIATAVAVSQDRFADGQAGAVVLARADEFADAIAGTPLAVSLDAPLLLTAGAALSGATAGEIERVLGGTGTVVLLGGTAALGEAVEEALVDAGYAVTRHAGANRYATSAAIDAALGHPAVVAYADGDTYADALIAGTAMAARGGSVLLSSGERLPDETASRAADAAYVVGAAAASAVPGARHVLVGANPAETSVSVAAALFADPERVGIATADAFPDALAGGAHAAGAGGPILLTPGTALDPAVRQYLTDTTAVTTATLYGGTLALTPAVEDAVHEALLR